MKCDICGNEVSNGFLVYGSGFTCEGCSDTANEKRKQHHADLLAEPIGEMPDHFETADFERFFLKFAVHWINQLPDSDRGKLNPIFLVPEELANKFKDEVLAHLGKYTSTFEARGHERLFHGGTYRIFKPIPCKDVHKAMKKAKLLA